VFRRCIARRTQYIKKGLPEAVSQDGLRRPRAGVSRRKPPPAAASSPAGFWFIRGICGIRQIQPPALYLSSSPTGLPISTFNFQLFLSRQQRDKLQFFKKPPSNRTHGGAGYGILYPATGKKQRRGRKGLRPRGMRRCDPGCPRGITAYPAESRPRPSSRCPGPSPRWWRAWRPEWAASPWGRRRPRTAGPSWRRAQSRPPCRAGRWWG